MYAIVQFPDTDCVSEVPSSWLKISGNKSQCWWPEKSKNVASLIANCFPPDESKWVLYDVVIERYCSNLEKARKVAENPTYTSTDDEHLGRGMRITMPQCDQSSSDEGLIDPGIRVRPLPPMPTENQSVMNKSATLISQSLSVLNNNHEVLPSNLFDSPAMSCNQADIVNVGRKQPDVPITSNIPAGIEDYITESSAHHNVTPRSHRGKPSGSRFGSSVVEGSVSDSPIIFGATPLATRSVRPTENMYDTLYIEESLRKIIRMLADINIQLKSIDNRLTSLEKKTNRQPLTEAETRFDLINTSLPIKTLDEITAFENLLTTNESAVSQFKNFVISIGGRLPKDNIYRVLPQVFDDSCAKQCSWKGRRNNFAVMKLKSINIIKDIICSSHEQTTHLDFESHGAEWFRFAKQRILRKEKNGQNP